MVRFSPGSSSDNTRPRRLIPVDTMPGEANRSDLSGPTVPRSHRVSLSLRFGVAGSSARSTRNARGNPAMRTAREGTTLTTSPDAAGGARPMAAQPRRAAQPLWRLGLTAASPGGARRSTLPVRTPADSLDLPSRHRAGRPALSCGRYATRAVGPVVQRSAWLLRGPGLFCTGREPAVTIGDVACELTESFHRGRHRVGGPHDVDRERRGVRFAQRDDPYTVRHLRLQRLHDERHAACLRDVAPHDRAGSRRVAARFKPGGATGSDNRVVVARAHVPRPELEGLVPEVSKVDAALVGEGVVLAHGGEQRLLAERLRSETLG